MKNTFFINRNIKIPKNKYGLSSALDCMINSVINTNAVTPKDKIIAS